MKSLKLLSARALSPNTTRRLRPGINIDANTYNYAMMQTPVYWLKHALKMTRHTSSLHKMVLDYQTVNTLRLGRFYTFEEAARDISKEIRTYPRRWNKIQQGTTDVETIADDFEYVLIRMRTRLENPMPAPLYVDVMKESPVMRTVLQLLAKTPIHACRYFYNLYKWDIDEMRDRSEPLLCALLSFVERPGVHANIDAISALYQKNPETDSSLNTRISSMEDFIARQDLALAIFYVTWDFNISEDTLRAMYAGIVKHLAGAPTRTSRRSASAAFNIHRSTPKTPRKKNNN